MIKLILSLLLSVVVVNCQAPNGIMWVDHEDHQQQHQVPIHHHHIHEQPREGEEDLGFSPLMGLKLAKPFGAFGLPGLRHSSLNIGRIGGFGYANTLLGSENPNAAEDMPQQETQLAMPQQGNAELFHHHHFVSHQADSQLAMPQQESPFHHHHHFINHQADSQLGNAQQYQAEAPQHYTPYQANLGAAPCSCAQPQQNYNLGTPMNAFSQPMGPLPPMFQPIVQPEFMPPQHQNSPVVPEQRTWGKGHDKGYG